MASEDQKNIIGLSFGVAGGDSITKGSGKQIVQDIKKIISQINKDDKLLPKVKIHFDTHEAIESLKEIEGEITKLNKMGKITVTNRTPQSKKAEDSAKKAIKERNDEYRKGIQTIGDYYKLVKELQVATSRSGTVTKSRSGEWSVVGDKSEYKEIVDYVNELRDKMKDLHLLGRGGITPAALSEEDIAKNAKKLNLSIEQYTKLVEAADRAYKMFTVNVEKSTRDQNDEYSNSVKIIKEYYAALKEMRSLEVGGGRVAQDASGAWKDVSESGAYKERVAYMNKLSLRYQGLGVVGGDMEPLKLNTSQIEANANRLNLTIHEYVRLMKEAVAANEKFEATGERASEVHTESTSDINSKMKLIKDYYNLLTEMKSISKKNFDITQSATGEWSDSSKGEHGQYAERIKLINKLVKAYQDLGISMGSVPDEEIEKNAKRLNLTVKDYKKLIEAAQRANDKYYKDLEVKTGKLDSTYAKNAAKAYEYIRRNIDIVSKNAEVRKQIKNLMDILSDPRGTENLDRLTKSFEDLQKKIRDTGADVETWGQKMTKTLISRVRSALAGIAIFKVTEFLRNIKTDVVALDSAMTDLQIASGKTREQVKNMIKTYSDLGIQLGATTVEVAKSADTWLRQGYAIEEANTLIRNSTILSKLGQIDATESSRDLTSAMKGYNVEVDKSIGIVDKLTAVDMVAAASAGDIANAMAETATGANIAGVSMDKLIGYIATVKEVTQDASESVGIFFKTLFARMGNVKAGKFVDDNGEAINDVEKVLAEFDIRLRSSTGDFRNFGDVLDEVSKKWNEYNNYQKRAIATAFAGQRQSEKFLTLMENYENATKYMNVAAESSGTALEKYEDYATSIAGRMNALKAASEGFALALVDNDSVSKGLKIITDAIVGLSKLVKTVGGLNNILAITIEIITLSQLKKLPNLITKITTLIGQLTLSFRRMGKTGEASTQKTISGMTKLKIGIGAVMTAINLAIVAYNLYMNNLEEGIERSSKASNEAAEKAKQHLEESKKLLAIAEKLEKINKSGSSADKSERLVQLQKEISEHQKNIVKITGNQGEQIDIVNGKLDTEIEKIKELSEAEKERYKTEANVALQSAKDAVKRRLRKGSKDVKLFDFADEDTDEVNQVISWLAEYGVTKDYFYQPSTMKQGMHIIHEYSNDVDSFIKQYEALLKIREEMANSGIDYSGSETLSAISGFLDYYEEVYEGYVSASNIVGALNKDGALDENPIVALSNINLANVNDMLKDLSAGFDTLSSVLNNTSQDSILTAEQLEKVLSLEGEFNKLGIDMGSILIKEADGYRLASDAMEQYLEAKIRSYQVEDISSLTEEGKKNLLTNLENLRLVLITLAATQDDVNDSSKKLTESLNKQSAALNDQLNSFRSVLDIRKELLQTYLREIEYQKELNRQQENVARLRTRLDLARLDTSASGRSNAEALQAELTSAEEDLERTTLNHTVEQLTEDIDKQYDEYSSMIQEKLDEIKEKLDNIGKNTEENNQYSKEFIKNSLSALGSLIDKIKAEHPESIREPMIHSNHTWFNKHYGGGLIKYETHHTGGFAGGSSILKNNEQFAKLLKGEFVATPKQMSNFMNKTLPGLTAGNNYNAPLVSITCDNISQDSIPEFKRIVNEAVDAIKQQLDEGMNRTGRKRPIGLV